MRMAIFDKSEFEALLVEWSTYADAMSDAVKCRDYEMFGKAFSNGKQCYQAAVALMKNADKSQFGDLKETAAKLAESWRRAVKSAAVWINDMKKESENVKKRKTVAGKLSGAYGAKGVNKTAVNLYIKAK